MAKLKKEPRIFLSYAHKDIATVRDIYKKLSTAGLKPWMDCYDIKYGQEWEPVTKEAIENAKFFLACLSQYCVNHEGQVQAEFKYALDVWQKKLPRQSFLIPVRLEDCDVPRDFKRFHWVNYFEEGGFSTLLKMLRNEMERLGIFSVIQLREKPQTLSDDELMNILQKYGFYDRYKNPTGKGIEHQYELIDTSGEKIVVDHTTGLTWQQGSSGTNIAFDEVQQYIKKINTEKFCGYSDWRLPTMEEAMSLMEPNNNRESGLFIDPMFNKKQRWIWTADKETAEGAWVVFFGSGVCNFSHFFNLYYVRAVRS